MMMMKKMMMVMMMMMMLRVKLNVNGDEDVVVGHPLNPTTIPLPSHAPSLVFGWSDLEMVLSAHTVRSQWQVGPLRSHHIS